MWKACSPGGRFLRLRSILTPFPPLASDSFAVPTSFPFASFKVTVTGGFAARRAVLKKSIAAGANIFLFNLSLLRNLQTLGLYIRRDVSRTTSFQNFLQTCLPKQCANRRNGRSPQRLCLSVSVVIAPLRKRDAADLDAVAGR